MEVDTSAESQTALVVWK